MLFPTTLFIVALTGMILSRTHLLSTLLCLESMILIIFLAMALGTHLHKDLILPLIILALSACDAGLGLSLMIATARTQGSDNLKTLHLLRW
uniref:NADH dehydrogenase subunit 4L n=1 Tax=Ptychadena amharensis TaxID=2806112 RepID=UPI00286C7D06|nr:NADH dehydrogenase subunit 4L [Ptychadena amharensis]WKT09060.1 NADH dehydrogenase subunit 4L [Ptychadena amharensis]WKT09073.1 NADH dehydrogenase subunit 4L [Ptychadena amharensis]WKT09086.1 NADH dehydrogenase subunit 4L [Ptychadena amharensis]WKT09099.1 NADH dehydrogenase subunit 4L [Ptychadena amharensis]WKT09112.1 NADH dehydrogenase subunit 4L [Ptychadena amharensis]